MKTRAIVGIVLFLAGIACFGGSGFVMLQAMERQTNNEDAQRKTEVACREQLVKLGRVQPRENNAVEVDLGEVRGDPRKALADVTAALAMCPGRNLQDVCLGAGCSSANAAPGAIRLSFRLGLGAGSPK